MSVFKKYRGKRIGPKDKNWSKARWYVWRRLNGKIIHKALPLAKTKEQAEQAERKLIDEAFEKRYGNGKDQTKFKDFAEGKYTRYVEQNNRSLANKRLYIKMLVMRFGERPLSSISAQDCRDYQAVLKKKYSASSVNLIMSTLQIIFRLAGEEDIVDKNPMQFVKRVKEPPPRNRLLSVDEKERLWTELEKDVLLLRFVTLAVNLPLRRGQLLAITPDAIDLSRGCLSAISSKGRGTRLVPLNSTASATFKIMLNDHQIPFPLKETGLRKRFNRALQRAGIEGFRFHDLRHVMATDLARNNVHPKTIQDLYGHSEMKITGIYINPEFEDMARAVRTLDEIQEIGEQ